MSQARKPKVHLITFSEKETMELHAEIMELYYTGDKIGTRNLAKQTGLCRNTIKSVLKKYYPTQGTRDIQILIGSVINYEEG